MAVHRSVSKALTTTRDRTAAGKLVPFVGSLYRRTLVEHSDLCRHPCVTFWEKISLRGVCVSNGAGVLPGAPIRARVGTRRTLLRAGLGIHPGIASGMNPRAVEIMREALEKISSIHKPTKDPVERYDPEELLEVLDFAAITAREALDRAVMPGECQN